MWDPAFRQHVAWKVSFLHSSFTCPCSDLPSNTQFKDHGNLPCRCPGWRGMTTARQPTRWGRAGQAPGAAADEAAMEPVPAHCRIRGGIRFPSGQCGECCPVKLGRRDHQGPGALEECPAQKLCLEAQGAALVSWRTACGLGPLVVGPPLEGYEAT